VIEAIGNGSFEPKKGASYAVIAICNKYKYESQEVVFNEK